MINEYYNNVTNDENDSVLNWAINYTACDEVVYEDLQIQKMNISLRTRNRLKNAEITKMSDLLTMKLKDLFKMPYAGEKTFFEIKQIITQHILVKKHVNNQVEGGLSGKYYSDDSKDCSFLENALAGNVNKNKILLFISENLFRDIAIDELKLSLRTVKCLHSIGIGKVSQISKLSEEKLYGTKNMGVKSINELKLEIKRFYEYESKNYLLEYKTTKFIRIFSNDFPVILNSIYYKEFEDGLVKFILNARAICSIELEEILSKKDMLIYVEFVKRVFETKEISDVFEKIVLGLVVNGFVKDKEQLKNLFPEVLIKTGLLNDSINRLVHGKKIELFNSQICCWKPTLIDFINNIKNSRKRECLVNRLNGYTLSETGIRLGITRERVRQIVKKVLACNDIEVQEDKFEALFKKYKFDLNSFVAITGQSEMVFRYLNLKYNHGDIEICKLLEDRNIDLNMVEKAKVYLRVNSDKLTLNNKAEVFDYVVKEYCKGRTTLEEFAYYYAEELKSNNIENSANCSNFKRALSSKLERDCHIINSIGETFRYYNNDWDINIIINQMNLKSFKNVEISTLLLFKKNKKVMCEWDIRDEYELHNLLRKRKDAINDLDIEIIRMPHVKFGVADRDKQVFTLLKKYSPVSNINLAQYYEECYGVKSQTVLATFFKNIEKFMNNGIYSLSVKCLPDNELSWLNHNMTMDIYNIKDIKDMYLKEYPFGNILMLNPYSFEKIGFSIFKNIVFKNKYKNIEKCCIEYFTREDIVDLRYFKELRHNQSIYASLKKLEQNMDIVEFLPNQFINISILTKNDITKEKIMEYSYKVEKFIGNQYFTIKYLRTNGFENPIKDCGFEDFFYESLLKSNCLFSYRRMGGKSIFKLCSEPITIGGFVKEIIYKKQSYDIYDLIDFLEKNYGIILKKHKLIEIANREGLYYNHIMEKIYMNYYKYFGEV